MFMNHPEDVNGAYERFMLNRLRELLPYPEVPIHLLFRGRGERKELSLEEKED